MDPQTWKRLESIFFAALELPPEQRSSFLDRACGGHASLRAEIDAVLAGHAQAGPAGPESSGGLTTPEPEPEPHASDSRIGPYRLDERIGRGGMGDVYRAHRADGQYEQQVAVKLLRPGLPGEEMVRRFRIERQVLARLQHPNVVPLLDGGISADGAPYLVMQYVDGSPITEYADREDLSIGERLRLFSTVCRAVHFAHTNLVVHRDLKPSNILVTNGRPGEAGGQVRLLDFGIAKLLDPEDMGFLPPPTAELLLLTPEHAAPEQILGDPITTATDIWGLGVLLYELLTGRRPFRASRGNGWHRAVCEREPLRPSDALSSVDEEAGELDAARVATRRGVRIPALRRELRGDLDHIVLKALRKEPADRYRSAEQLADDIERYLDARPVLARRGTISYRARKFLHRNRFSVAAAAMVGLLLLGASVFSALQSLQRAAALQVAESERDRARTALDEALLENSRAHQLTTLLIGLFEAPGDGESREDSLAVERLLQRGLARAEGQYLQPEARARMLTALGRVDRHIGNYARAVAYLERAIDLQRDLPEEQRGGLSESLIALADVYTQMDRGQEAEELLREAIAIDNARLGGDYPRVAWALSQLTLLLIGQGEYEQAEAVARQTLGMRQRLARGSDSGVAGAMLDLALLLRRRGAYAEAEALYRQALEIRSRLYPRQSWQTAELLTSLGLAILDRGRAAEAEPLLGEAVEIYRHVYGDQHPSVATAINALARSLSDQAKDAEAERLFHTALEMRRVANGPSSARVVATLLPMGDHRMRLGDLDGAEASYREALEIRSALGVGDHPETALALVGMGRVHRRRGDLVAAERLLSEALRIQQQKLGTGHPLLAATQRELGLVLVQRGDYQPAERLLQSALRSDQAVFSPGSPAAARSADALVQLYEAWGRPKDAARLRPLVTRASSGPERAP